MRAFLPSMILSLAAFAPAGPAAATPPDFGAHWHDGRAELDGYRWTGSRYGEERSGQAVMIFVTEPFSESRRVKLDDPSRDPGDAVDVLKLNLVRDFQTGIYDYNTMVSAFVRTADLSPVKVSFSSAEWCGHVYAEQRFDPGTLREHTFSYFEGETSDRTLDHPEGGLTEDLLFITLRGLRGDYLAPGETRTVPFLPGLFFRRLVHRPAAWTTLEIERLSENESLSVPAGTFETVSYLLRTGDGRSGRFDLEAAYPHRIVRWFWTASPGGGRLPGGTERGELTGSARLEYWTLNGNGDESHLEALGLEPLPEN